MLNTKKFATKAVRGPGGLRCSCCRPWGSKKRSRTLHNRGVRRQMNRTLYLEIENILGDE